MVGFVDETIAGGELQVVKDHLSRCEECETAVDDLRAFKEQIAPELERAGRPSQMGAATESRWRSFIATMAIAMAIASMASSRPKSRALVFGSALAILLLSIGWLGRQALQGLKSKPEVAVTALSPG